MPLALAAADLVVARAGASTLGEFPALALPSILAPYPYSGQHQEVNADYLAQRGAAIRLPDAQLSTQLAPTVLRLLSDPAELDAMSQAARALAQPAAAEAIGQESAAAGANRLVTIQAPGTCDRFAGPSWRCGHTCRCRFKCPAPIAE